MGVGFHAKGEGFYGNYISLAAPRRDGGGPVPPDGRYRKPRPRILVSGLVSRGTDRGPDRRPTGSHPGPTAPANCGRTRRRSAGPGPGPPGRRRVRVLALPLEAGPPPPAFGRREGTIRRPAGPGRRQRSGGRGGPGGRGGRSAPRRCGRCAGLRAGHPGPGGTVPPEPHSTSGPVADGRGTTPGGPGGRRPP